MEQDGAGVTVQDVPRLFRSRCRRGAAITDPVGTAKQAFHPYSWGRDNSAWMDDLRMVTPARIAFSQYFFRSELCILLSPTVYIHNKRNRMNNLYAALRILLINSLLVKRFRILPFSGLPTCLRRFQQSWHLASVAPLSHL